jgi:hypothetical protein
MRQPPIVIPATLFPMIYPWCSSEFACERTVESGPHRLLTGRVKTPGSEVHAGL